VRFDDLDDATLVREFARSSEAFAALYRRYERAVLGYFVRRTATPEAAADLAAETFAAALEGLRAGNGPSGWFGGWLFGIARHKLADSYRRGVVEDEVRRRLRMEPLTLTDDELERIHELGAVLPVQALVAGLPADQREAIAARIVDERDYAEVADRLACSQMVARKRVSRGLAALRTRLEGQSK
jgi:RNA polymerase sigma factor (sigma-70 family)